MNYMESKYFQLTKGKITAHKERNQAISGVISSHLSDEFATNEPYDNIESSDEMLSLSSSGTLRLTRSTRRMIDHPPVRLNSLLTFYCKRFFFRFL